MPLPGRLLKLHSLRCSSTEDWTGADECRLEITVDSVPMPPLRRSLNDNQTWTIEQSFPFVSSVTVTLMDEDAGFGDSDDNLGTQRIDATIRSNATVTFTEDGASYTLTYSVEQLVKQPPIDPELPIDPPDLPGLPSGIPVPLPVSLDLSPVVAGLAGIQASIGGLAGAAGGILGAIAGLNSALAGIQGTLAGLAAGAPQVQSSLAAIASAVEDVETVLTQTALAGALGGGAVPSQPTPSLP